MQASIVTGGKRLSFKTQNVLSKLSITKMILKKTGTSMENKLPYSVPVIF